MKIKEITKKILIIFMIICTILPSLVSPIVLAAEDEVILTQERAGNYAASFAINFYNNWSSMEHGYKDEDKSGTSFDPMKAIYSTNYNIPNEGDSIYYLSKESWIDFVYTNALSLSGSQLPTRNIGAAGAYDQIKVDDLKTDLLKSEDDKSNANKEEHKTIVELMNAGKIIPGDILITSEKDYLLYVGGTRVIYATPPDGIHPTERNSSNKQVALKYDFIQNYFVEVKRHLLEEHNSSKDPNNKDDDDFEPKYGITEVYRISQDSLNKWGVYDSKANIMFNDRGYYDSNNDYKGLPDMKEAAYLGSTHKSLIATIIEGLKAIVKFLINLTAYLVRAVIIGWVDLFESLVQTIILKLSGHSNKVSFVDKLHGISSTSYAGERVTVESFMFNKVPLTDANFFNMETAGGYELLKDGKPISWLYNIRGYMSVVYFTLRNISIALMIFVLMYTAIRMALSTIARRKAQLSKQLTAWFVGLCIILFIHIFMYLVLFVNDQLVDIFMDQNTAAASEIIGEETDSLTLYDAIRTKAYSWDIFDGTAGLIMYIIMVYFLVRFLFIYLKRMISIYVLAIYGSIIGVKYAIEKSTGKRSSNSFGRWMKDFTFNVLLQSIHCLIYVTLMGIAVKAAIWSPGGIIVAILICQFILKADVIFMKIFDVKGSLLDDTNKAPKIQGLLKSAMSAVQTAALGYGVFKAGKQLLGKDTGIRPMLRYALNYKEGDTDKETIARGESKRLNRKATIAGALYYGTPMKGFKKKDGKIALGGNSEIELRRRELYAAIKATDNYQIKKAIMATIEAEKKLRKERIARPFKVGGRLVSGAVGAGLSIGLLTEGVNGKEPPPAIISALAAAKALKPSNKQNLKLYRRLNPNEKISGGIIGEAELKNIKTEKDLKKLKDKQDALIRIAQIQGKLDSKIEELSRQSGMTKEEIYQKLQGTVVASQKSSIGGRTVRSALDNYAASHVGKSKLNESDLDDVLVQLQRELNEARSDIVLDDATKERIKDEIRKSGKSLDDINKKEFAKILAEAIDKPEVISVVPGGKVKGAAEAVSLDKLSSKVISEYENLTGTTLSDDMKKAFKKKMKHLSGINDMTEDQIVDKALGLMDDLSFDKDKLKEATEKSVVDGPPKLDNDDFHAFMRKVEQKVKSKGIDVDLTLKNGNKNNLSPIEQAVKQKVIAKQKTKYAGDPTKTAEIAKLNNGEIAEATNSEMAQMVYEALSEPGAVPVVTASDSTIQNILQEASEYMKQIISINQANIAKNKESAVGYGSVMHEMLKNFGKEVQ
jgi:hypothetical protein